MFLHLDPGSGVPLYRQIVDGVRFSVASGTLSPGDRLPSVRELAVGLGVNPTTIQKAYGELEHQGVIETRRGQGTFVAEAPEPVRAKERRAALREEIRALLVRAAERGATREEIEKLVSEGIEKLFGAKE